MFQMKTTEQCFRMLLFIMLCKVVLTFESVDEILIWCVHSIKGTGQYFLVVQNSCPKILFI